MDGSAELEQGAHFTLDDNDAPGDASRVHLPHPEILSALEPGHAILIDDGKLRLEVEEVAPGHRARAVVRVGGKVSDRKGVSLPDTTLPLAAMTDKDRADLEAAIEIGVDWIALSFVQRPEDIAEVKKVARGRAQVLAKLEKPQALARLDEIMDVSDAIMVARGDLGVEMPLEKVPGPAKAHHPQCAARRQAGDRGDADARIDDHRPGAHPRRGLGCGRPLSMRARMR